MGKKGKEVPLRCGVGVEWRSNDFLTFANDQNNKERHWRERGAHGEGWGGGWQQIDDGRTGGTRIVGPRAPHTAKKKEAPNRIQGQGFAGIRLSRVSA